MSSFAPDKIAAVADAELIRYTVQGDQRAFGILFERYRVPLYRFCLLMIGQRAVAEDIYQEAFISLYRICRQGEDVQNVRAYLLTVARRRCLNYLRDNGKIVPLEEDIELVYEINIDQLGLNAILQKALRKLPVQNLESLLLFEIEGYSYKEIATVLNVTVDVIRNRIYRAKKALQKILGPVLDPENAKS